MQWMFRMLLRLYPRAHRFEFADEMMNVFAQQATERRELGWRVYTGFLFRECLGVCISAAREQPALLHFMPAVGGISVAALLHMAIYAVIFRVFDAVARAIGNISLATHQAAPSVIAVTMCVATLLGLLPLFFLLSMQLLRRLR